MNILPGRTLSNFDDQADGLPYPRRFFAFLAVLIGVGAAVFDGIGINIALPTIASDFQISPAASTWVVNAYQIALIMGLFPLATVGDIVGYRRLYLVGLVTMAVMAACSALAPNYPVLIVCRAVQGLGAACTMSVNLALLRHIVPRAVLGRAIGLNAMILAITASLGPSVAGAIITVSSWHWVFSLTVVTGSVGAVAGLLALPTYRNSATRFDFVSALLSAAAFGGVLLGISGIAHQWSGVVNAAAIACGIGAGVGLVRRQRREAAPMLPLDLLRIPIFALSLLASVTCFCAQMIAFVSLPFYLEHSLHFPVIQAGTLFACWPFAVAITAPFAGFLADRVSAGIVGFVGLMILAGGLFALLQLPQDPETFDVVWRMMLCGAGFGLFQSPNNRTLIGSAPKSRSAAAGGALATARLLGQTCGTALATLALSSSLGGDPSNALRMGLGFALAGAAFSVLRRGKVTVL